MCIRDSEYTAFKTYASLYPDACMLLVDTYDTLKSGVPNAIRVFKELRDEGLHPRKIGIRLDSGDLAYLSKKARAMLDLSLIHIYAGAMWTTPVPSVSVT